MHNNPIDYNSIKSIHKFMQNLNIGPRKSLGQNFLINQEMREKIIRILDITAEDEIWEIGPGLGAMTSLIYDKVSLLKTFEIDLAYQKILKDFFGFSKNFEIIPGDVLKTFNNCITSENVKILGNLPYNIAAAIIKKMAQNPFKIALIVIQKELGERMISEIRKKSYSSFSVWVQCHFECKTYGMIKPHMFYPIPKVDSVILGLKPKKIDKNLSIILDLLLRICFSNRRKVLKNNLDIARKRASDSEIIMINNIEKSLISSGTTLKARAEELSPSLYLNCASQLLEDCSHTASSISDFS